MALFSKKNLVHYRYGLTEEDLKGNIKRFPIEIVERMMYEQELQGNKPDAKAFQISTLKSFKTGGFNWDETEAGFDFWKEVIANEHFFVFYKLY